MTRYRSAVKWSEPNEHGYEYVVGAAFGYPMRLEVGPRDGGIMWRVGMLDQILQPGTCSTREEARATALRVAADWLLLQAVDSKHRHRVRVEEGGNGNG